MPKSKKTKPTVDSDRPTDEQFASGQYEHQFITHVETSTKREAYRRKQTRSAFERLCERGAITDDHLQSVSEIGAYLEFSARSLATKGASMEARVDCSNSSSHAMNESLRMVRLERAYGVWFRTLKLPRQMFVDMIFEDSQLAAIARSYNKSWVKARELLIDELDRWPALRDDAIRGIRHEDLLIQHARLSV